MVARTPWTKEEDAFLIANQPTMTMREIGERLDRPRNAVIGRWNRLNGRKKERRPPAIYRKSGWPRLYGAQHERDREFVAAIIEAARREGLLAA